jgi:hypothetical protein
MGTITRKCRVGSDGNVIVPVGLDEAGREVEVTVQEVQTTPAERWHEFLRRTEGSITDGTFERHSEGKVESRMGLE